VAGTRSGGDPDVVPRGDPGADGVPGTATRAPSLEVLVRSLSDPACYPHALDAPVRVIETHISYVLVGGGHAYKLKKPLDLGFLDFGTLERRRECCELEVRLNRRLAPAIYLDVVAIRWDGRRAWVVAPGACAAAAGDGDDEDDGDGDGQAGHGPVVEHAVHMRAFDPDDLLDRRLAQGQLDAAMVDAVAAVIARFHGRIDVAGPGSGEGGGQGAGFGTPRAVWAPVRANFRTLARSVQEPGQRATLARLACWSRRERARLDRWFSDRRAGGCVRECHGDLHLGNIAWVDGEPCVFDCIEFNPELRWIDIAAEIAFTVMDLADRGRPDLGWRLLDAWLATTGDYDALPGLRFYLSYRALVRAKVATLRLAQPHGDAAQDARLRHEQAGYVALADALSRPRRMLMITHGFSGSGKSHGASWLLMQVGAVRVRSDVERKRLSGRDALDRGAADAAPDAGLYAPGATRLTYDRLETVARSALEGGFPVIVDAAFLQRPARDRFRALARTLDVPFVILSFVAPQAQLRARVAARAASGLDASDAGPEVLAHQLRSAQALQADERPYVLQIDASDRAFGDGADAALEAVAAELQSRLAPRRDPGTAPGCLVIPGTVQ
jgi:aminoglycoside phosphotransferase family enzyme/predicted kinase